MQEDKERLFDTADTVRACLRLMATMLAHTSVNRDMCTAASADPLLLATDLADYLVKKGMPFRNAHHVVGAVVALAEMTRRPLNELTVADLRGVDPTFSPDVVHVFDLKKAMARRTIVGAPGTKEVQRQLARWQKLLGL